MSYVEDLMDEIYPENYMFPMIKTNYYVVSAVTFLGFLYSQKQRLWRYLFYSPGYGKIEQKRDKKTKNNQLFVQSDIGKIKIPTRYW